MIVHYMTRMATGASCLAKQKEPWFSFIQTYHALLASQSMAMGYQEHESLEASVPL